MTEPLSPEQVQDLPEGQPITVIWSGGNGPCHYLIAVDRKGRRYASMESDFANERLRYYNPLTFVGVEKPRTRVWLRAEEES